VRTQSRSPKALRHVLIPLLVVLTACLVPLAEASPPDQSWLGGLYDDADYDDVVVSVTSAVSAVESHSIHETGPVQTITERTIHVDESAPALPALSQQCSRAPPTA
jgi:hypothetical protein